MVVPWCVVAAQEGWRHALGDGGKVKALLACEQMMATPLDAVYLLRGIILLPFSPPAPVNFLGENSDRVGRAMTATYLCHFPPWRHHLGSSHWSAVAWWWSSLTLQGINFLLRLSLL